MTDSDLPNGHSFKSLSNRSTNDTVDLDWWEIQRLHGFTLVCCVELISTVYIGV